MQIDAISAGRDIPHDLNVIIEIPAHSEPVKYEVDKASSALMVDRFIGTFMRYPCNYGYVPHTLSEDGDPLDVLVLSPLPVLSGAVIRCRPIGLLMMTDESGKDAKILAVPHKKLSNAYEDMQDISDVPQHTLDQIAHFFEHYKDLEPGKWVKLDGWSDVKAAEAEILSGIKRHNSDSDS